jgi:hypothetical protein
VTEPGINSPEEFLLLYLCVGVFAFIAWAFWDSTEEIERERRRDDPALPARQRRRCRVIAVLGVVNVGFALAALDRANQRARESADADGDIRWARAWVVIGTAAVLIALLPHLGDIADLVA